MLRRILDMTGGLIIGLAVAAGIHCGADGPNSSEGSDGSFVDSASAADSGGGGDGGVPAWAAHEGFGACAVDSVSYYSGTPTTTRRTIQYDAHGRVVAMVYADGTSTEWTYNDDGRLHSRTAFGEGGAIQVSDTFDWSCN